MYSMSIVYAFTSIKLFDGQKTLGRKFFVLFSYLHELDEYFRLEDYWDMFRCANLWFQKISSENPTLVRFRS